MIINAWCGGECVAHFYLPGRRQLLATIVGPIHCSNLFITSREIFFCYKGEKKKEKNSRENLSIQKNF